MSELAREDTCSVSDDSRFSEGSWFTFLAHDCERGTILTRAIRKSACQPSVMCQEEPIEPASHLDEVADAFARGAPEARSAVRSGGARIASRRGRPRSR